nr:immunoglobulin light chain junction region [Macaca mulatta]
CMQPLDFPLTF